MSDAYKYPCGEIPEKGDLVEAPGYVDRAGGEVISVKKNAYEQVTEVKVRWEAIESFGNHSSHSPRELVLKAR